MQQAKSVHACAGQQWEGQEVRKSGQAFPRDESDDTDISACANASEVEQCYRQAAAAGSAKAMMHVGNMCLDDAMVDRRPEGLAWLQKSGDAGHSYAVCSSNSLIKLTIFLSSNQQTVYCIGQRIC